MASDKDLGMHLAINRREFMQGSAVAVSSALAACGSFAGPEQNGRFTGSPEIDAAYYPPGLTELRGSHVGSFEVAHQRVHEGKAWNAGASTDEGEFDLIVIGGGLSGLAAAWFYRKQNPGARVLILESHDDFGGHAKRNEFQIGDRTLIGYGGSQSLDAPSSFSKASKDLMRDLGVNMRTFYKAFDSELYEKRDLRSAYWLDKATFGSERLVQGNYFIAWGQSTNDQGIEGFARGITGNEDDYDRLLDLLRGETDYLPGKTPAEKFDYLRKISYEDYLRKHVGLSEAVLKIMNPLTKGIWGVGSDAVSAREAAYLSMSGFDGLGLGDFEDDPYLTDDHDDPYIFHFPDGNAGIARLLVRKLIPESATGSTMEDVVTTRFKYQALDLPDNDVKIRLNATVVHAEHLGSLKSAQRVGVRYIKSGTAYDVVAKNVVYAGYSAMLAHVFPEFPRRQIDLFKGQVRAPLMYANVAIRNWQAFDKAGLQRLYYPGGLLERVALDFPVSLGSYKFSSDPSEPMLLHMDYIPAEPGKGLDNRTQMRIGRQKMLALNFDDYERAARSQLGESLSHAGFDPARDIVAMTVNRWPHGYAYEYSDLYDDPSWNRYKGPHIDARKGFGRVAIAGSDSEAYAYVNGAVDAAWRAVQELA